MFLIRTAFWLSLVILFIPTGESNQPDAGPVDSNAQVSAIEALSAAIKVFGQKAQYGARKIYEYIAEANSQTDPSADAAPFARDGIDTLLQADKDIPWQGAGSQG